MLVERLKQKSFSESEVLVSQSLEIEIQNSPQIHYQADNSVRLEVTLSKAQWEMITEMRELLSHSLPNGSWAEILEYVASKVIEKKNPKARERKNEKTGLRKPLGNTTAEKTPPAAAAPATTATRSLQKIRQHLLRNHRGCQYRDAKTGKVCASKWQLEVDHIQPRWAGGTDAPENLRLLCASHYTLRVNPLAFGSGDLWRGSTGLPRFLAGANSYLSEVHLEKAAPYFFDPCLYGSLFFPC